ncbi:cell division protein FtsB [Endobacter medicaginis]|uniref:Cell division protein FtsB n=1 Tax=Endobacter medicaginis TaxID=1181271 RepID=A0A839UXD9_9PROT|nr:septum formation initiator family protein [Endobacter medicaginis]MBB3172750.1 cell division protein FtsB [Endobacter medicaginis]MCX5474357.1 septum formation initiator family protein [Endobacter medicaginis]NVN29369.1 septum formation initiator family protein [Endobacter medicaginis]
MSITRYIKRKVRAAVPPAIFLALVGYFGWNAFQGAHGLRSYEGRLQMLAQAQAAQTDSLALEAAWRRRVAGLRDNGLDADTLDERARAMLNLAEPNEIVIPYGRDKLY